MTVMRIKNHFVCLDQIRNFGFISDYVYIDFINGDTSSLRILCKDDDEAANICWNIELRMTSM